MYRRLIYLTVLLFLCSCERVIELDLKGVDAKYVVEGTLSDRAGDCRVLITQTKDFDQNNDFPGVQGALVYIRIHGDNPASTPGDTVHLTETEPGVYEAPAFAGMSGETYTLEVALDESRFTATSTMPAKVNLDTLYVTNENYFGETWKLANLILPDPAGVENFYRCIQYINGKKSEQLFLLDDDLVDGLDFESKLYMDPGLDDDERIHSGDSLTVELLCIDRAVYKYWMSLDQSSRGNGSPITPANPVSNLRGGALGYFSAHTIQSRTIVVP